MAIFLGQILWNFEEWKMEFSYKGKKVIVGGNRSTIVHWTKVKVMISNLNLSIVP